MNTMLRSSFAAGFIEAANRAGTDKAGLDHTFAGFNYMDHYARLMGKSPMFSDSCCLSAAPPFKEIVLVEFGVFRGASMKMWRRLFPTATIIGVDNDVYFLDHPEKAEEIGFVFMHGQQTETKIVSRIVKDYGIPSLVVDDGSHAYSDMIETAINCIPYMKPGGLYVIEDTHVGWASPQWPGMARTRNGPNRMRELFDFVNAIMEGIMRRSGLVLSVHFFHGMIAFEIADETWHPPA